MPQKTSTGFSLKDHLFNRQRVEYLASLFSTADPSFDTAGFIADTLQGFKTLELKQRIAKIASTLVQYLDQDFRKAAKQIVAALPPPLDPTLSDDDFGDFIFAPLGEYVVRCGRQPDHLRLSLGKQREDELRWMIRHALRTLVKQGDSRALQLLGFRPRPVIDVSQFALTQPKTRPGEAIEFSFAITARPGELLVIDYVIDFVK